MGDQFASFILDISSVVKGILKGNEIKVLLK
jgi:hypothetical protein